MEKIPSLYKQRSARHWMVVYTRSNWEKKADKLLNAQGITSFCPVVRTQKKWADRNKTIETPLFDSYLFVCVTAQEQSKVQQVPGILNFIQHCGKPVFVTNDEINRIRTLTSNYSDLRTIDSTNLTIGDKIKFNEGPLTYCNGEIIQLQYASVVMVMKDLGCAVIVKVNDNQICMNTNMMSTLLN